LGADTEKRLYLSSFIFTKAALLLIFPHGQNNSEAVQKRKYKRITLKKSKNTLAKCQCCLTERHSSEMQVCLSILEKIERHSFKRYEELGLDQYRYASFINSSFEWACDICLKNKKAIFAVPGLQETPWTPHLAYYDSLLHCYSCKKEFLFKKEEKKAWYESYKLPT
jgi:hypothetical protein